MSPEAKLKHSLETRLKASGICSRLPEGERQRWRRRWRETRRERAEGERERQPQAERCLSFCGFVWVFLELCFFFSIYKLHLFIAHAVEYPLSPLYLLPLPTNLTALFTLQTCHKKGRKFCNVPPLEFLMSSLSHTKAAGELRPEAGQASETKADLSRS